MEKLANEKDHIYKEQNYETQLHKVNAEKTLENRVDLEKLQEIRLCLRRRYASRQNIRKIFKDWDKQNTGEISVYDAYKMINKLSIPINIDETRALISSSNQRKTENLNIKEFMHLIYNDNDELNLKLKHLNSKKNIKKIFHLTSNNPNNLKARMTDSKQKGKNWNFSKTICPRKSRNHPKETV